MRDVAGVPTVTREQAQRVATASPATPLVGHRGAGSSHGRGWRAHGRRRAGWACLLPCQELAGEGGSGNVAVGGGGGGSDGGGGDGGGNGDGGGRGGGGAAAASSGTHRRPSLPSTSLDLLLGEAWECET